MARLSWLRYDQNNIDFRGWLRFTPVSAQTGLAGLPRSWRVCLIKAPKNTFAVTFQPGQQG